LFPSWNSSSTLDATSRSTNRTIAKSRAGERLL
jgi:hypothetical protein